VPGSIRLDTLRTLDIDLGGPVNLEATLECGQAFRWRKVAIPGRRDVAASYLGVMPLLPASGRRGTRQIAAIVGQTDKVTDRLTVAYDAGSHGCASPGAVQEAILRYFSAGDDLPAIERDIAGADPVMAATAPPAHGLRILRQDPWECLASYVLSINNNIPNIGKIVEHLARYLGEPVGFGESGFPSPELVACQENGFLRESKCGFRDRYLKDATEKVVSGEVDLAALGDMPTEQARERLMRIRGVGPKVADCVLLFAYHRLDVFPVDVWIARAMSRFYLDGRPVTPKVAREEGARRFGALAGYAQEYLFCHIRSGLAG